jgi:hypothetical protein
LPRLVAGDKCTDQAALARPAPGHAICTRNHAVVGNRELEPFSVTGGFCAFWWRSRFGDNSCTGLRAAAGSRRSRAVRSLPSLPAPLASQPERLAAAHLRTCPA